MRVLFPVFHSSVTTSNTQVDEWPYPVPVPLSFAAFPGSGFFFTSSPVQSRFTFFLSFLIPISLSLSLSPYPIIDPPSCMMPKLSQSPPLVTDALSKYLLTYPPLLTNLIMKDLDCQTINLIMKDLDYQIIHDSTSPPRCLSVCLPIAFAERFRFSFLPSWR